MAKLRGEEIIARGFQNEGVDTFFFMMGGPTSGTAGACLELGMQGIYVRHEQTAAMAAHAIHPLVFPDEALHFEYSTNTGVTGF